MSFAAPLVLLALLGVPPLFAWYVGQQRRRRRVAGQFVTEPLRPSVAPTEPGWRRHAPMLVIAVAVIVLIIGAARPQHSVAVPVDDGAVMLANDTSASMASNDVSPSRELAAANAARKFVDTLPANVRVGLLEFNVTATVLQSPTRDHALTRSALSQLRAPRGHTYIGTTIQAVDRVLGSLRSSTGKRVPSAIVLLSDGGSNGGADPIAAARQSKADHIPIYTVALGTPRGTIPASRAGRPPTPVPLDPSELRQIGQVSGGRAFTVGDAGGLDAVYAHLATQLGHKHVKQQITASFAGIGALLLLAGGALSLRWFGRPI
jgi:Ca-activated chloride channel homolog